MYVKVNETRNTIYTDYIRKLPVTSQRGHNYQMIMCYMDSNEILEDMMKTKTRKEIIIIYQSLLNRPKESGIKPHCHIQNNGISDAYKKMIK